MAVYIWFGVAKSFLPESGLSFYSFQSKIDSGAETGPSVMTSSTTVFRVRPFITDFFGGMN